MSTSETKRAEDVRVLHTSAGDLPLEEYHLAIDGHAWRILHSGAVVSAEDEQRFLGRELRLPYGIVLWPAALAMAHELATRDLHGKKVLELGAGTGLPGIVAATRGARVVQTERQDVAMFVCRKNGERNGVGQGANAIEYRAGDWTAWDDTSTYDLIVGSDVLYGSTMHPHLRHIFETNLAPGGVVLLSDPFRPSSFALPETMAAEGWNVAISKWTVSVTPPPRLVGIFELSRPAPSARHDAGADPATARTGAP